MIALAVALLGLPAVGAHTTQQEAVGFCVGKGAPGPVCNILNATFEGLKRPGVSAGDFTGKHHDVAVIDVADFYFAPRVAKVRDGQLVAFQNINLVGGNRHSVASSDWAGASPVLPIPGGAAGGGRGFSSGVLQPESALVLRIDLASIHPDAVVPLANDEYLIAYHCYIHTATVMQGQLIVVA